MKPNPRTVLGASLILLVLSACGPSSSDGSTTTTTTAQSSTSTQATSNTQPGGLGGVTQACIDTAQAFSGALTGFATVMNGLTPAQAEAYRTQLGDIISKVPSELRDDFDHVTQALDVFYEGIAEMGLQSGIPITPAQMTRYAELAEELNKEPFEGAMQRVSTWFQANCS
jgi:hypothetical protein